MLGLPLNKRCNMQRYNKLIVGVIGLFAIGFSNYLAIPTEQVVDICQSENPVAGMSSQIMLSVMTALGIWGTPNVT